MYQASNAYPCLIDQRANVECLGFGFVRSIDMTRREIHLIVPDRTLVKTMINAIIKGNDDCPEEFYLMSIERVRSLENKSRFFLWDCSSGVVICLPTSQVLLILAIDRKKIYL